MLESRIREMAAGMSAEVIGIRRHLHAHPELSFKEFGTSAFIKAQLDKWGISWTAVAGTGVRAILKGELVSEKVIALRADMDALAIQETNEVDYVSQSPGVMHACGHDVHTSSLLATAKILQALRSEFGGTIKFLFQPGEEVLPGGAGLMIKEGVLDNPRVSAIIGQHVMPSIPVGKIGMRKGRHMASMDELYFTIHGKGGHGAQPQQNIDPVLISSHIIVALQQLVSRMANPYTPSVLSFGKVIANGTHNVIPDQVYMEGTFRTLDEEWRRTAHERMIAMAEQISASMGGRCEFRIVKGYPVLVNEEALTAALHGYACEYLGRDHVVDTDIWMAAEDFAYYAQVTDGCFYLLGTGNEARGISSSVHTPDFDIDEQALCVGSGLMAYLALRRLGSDR